MLKPKSKETVDLVVKMLRNELHRLTAVFLFGSRATNLSNHNSDWDFAFLHRPAIELVKLWDLKSNIESEIKASIDLVDLYHGSTVIQIEILKNGKLIWNNDEFEVATFEYMALSIYQKLNLERAGILKGLHQRGNIYG